MSSDQKLDQLGEQCGQNHASKLFTVMLSVLKKSASLGLSPKRVQRPLLCRSPRPSKLERLIRKWVCHISLRKTFQRLSMSRKKRRTQEKLCLPDNFLGHYLSITLGTSQSVCDDERWVMGRFISHIRRAIENSKCHHALLRQFNGDVANKMVKFDYAQSSARFMSRQLRECYELKWKVKRFISLLKFAKLRGSKFHWKFGILLRWE